MQPISGFLRSIVILFMIVVLTCLGHPVGTSAEPLAPANDWNALLSGLNGEVHAILVDGPNVYVGGSFTATSGGGTTLNGVARWDTTTSTWNALGSGVVGISGSTQTVYALDLVGTDLYVGGSFTSAGGITTINFAWWDTFSGFWHSAGMGMVESTDAVYTLAHQGNDIYVGGAFTDVDLNGNGPDPADVDNDYLLRWDPDTGVYSKVASEPFNGSVHVIKIVGALKYVGGEFHDLGVSGNVDYISYSTDDLNWYGMTGLNGIVYDIEALGVYVYAGGAFTNTSGNASCDAIARWDGSAWQAVACGLNDDSVGDLVIVGNDIYAGGIITDAGGSAGPDKIARWDGTEWQPLGSGINGNIYPGALWLEGSKLYAGGGFTSAGGISGTGHIAYWDITESSPNWFDVGGGLNGEVEAMVIVGPDIFVGGQFTNAGGIAEADYIARWDGSQWHALGDGLNGPVYALKAVGAELYVGGAFTDAAPAPIRSPSGLPVDYTGDYIARWFIPDSS